MDDRRILTVSELNGAIRGLLEGRFPFVSVSGEISNLHKPYSGHFYFTLKDNAAQIKAVLFKMQQRYLVELPKDGAHVLCRGRISVYEPRGEYQLIIDTLEYQGTGALQQAFDRLKQRLAAEGLFDEHLKRPLPRIPDHITLITSPHGAAVHDFIRIARRRYPPVRIAVYPVSVQGDQAASEMRQALADINALASTDVIVLCRGGGSIEDLQAFNDEKLARAIRASALPVVSAVGHEIDFTIADFAADQRAPTPSGAAEILTPDGTELRRNVRNHGNRLRRCMLSHIGQYEHRLQWARHHLAGMTHALDNHILKLDQMSLSLSHAMKAILAGKQRRLDAASLSMDHHNPSLGLALQDRRLHELQTRLIQAMKTSLGEKTKQITATSGVLHAVSPLATLERGYSIVRKTTGKKPVITDQIQVSEGETVEVILHQGHLHCRVTGKR